MVFETVAILPPKLIGALQRRNRCGISKSGFLSVDCTLILLEIVTERFRGSIDASGPTPGGKYLSIKPPVAANGYELQLLCPLLARIFGNLSWVAIIILDLTWPRQWANFAHPRLGWYWTYGLQRTNGRLLMNRIVGRFHQTVQKPISSFRNLCAKRESKHE